MEKIKLTQYSKSGGCGCKIAPSALKDILKTNIHFSDSNVLVGYEKSDDAAVYRLNDTTAIISTTDFFTPIVDDPFDFGQIAACNALSDVYAMGGKPLMAIAILGWPTQQLGTASAAKVLDGARTICTKANITLAGGHSIESSEPFFGLAVTGTISTSHIKQNNTIEEGDILYLTKPIGTGIMSAALKRGVLKQDDYKSLLDTMTQLNHIGNILGECAFVTAMTDITGFGLVGHALEMIGDKSLGIEFQKTQIPLLNHVEDYQQQFIYPDNTTRNYNTYQDKVSGLKDLDFMLYFDPQTSGGLLFSIKEKNTSDLEELLKQKKVFAHKIGRVCQRAKEDKVLLKFL
jgi:selenide, water dikinase